MLPLDNEALTKWGQLSKKSICSRGSKFFSLRVDPLLGREKKTMNGRVAFPSMYQFTLGKYYKLYIKKTNYEVCSKQGCHLSSTSKFPDFSLTFYSFPYPLTDKKNNIIYLLYFNGASTSNLGVTLKGINMLPKGSNCFPLSVTPMREMGLDYLMRNSILSLLNRINKFSEDCLP